MYSRELEMTGLECGFVIPYLSENFVYLPLLSLEIRHLGCCERRGSYLHSFSIILCERTDICWRYVALNAFKWPYSARYPFSLFFLVCTIESVNKYPQNKEKCSIEMLCVSVYAFSWCSIEQCAHGVKQILFSYPFVSTCASYRCQCTSFDSHEGQEFRRQCSG